MQVKIMEPAIDTSNYWYCTRQLQSTNYSPVYQSLQHQSSSYSFADFINECRTLDKVRAVDYDSPEVLNSAIANKVVGDSTDQVIVVFPVQLLSDISKLLLEYPDVVIHKQTPTNNANRSKFISQRIVFVPSTLVRNVQTLLKQKQTKNTNELYTALLDVMRGNACPADRQQQISQLVNSIALDRDPLRLLAGRVRPHRVSVSGYIPKRVVYIQSDLLDCPIIAAQSYRVINPFQVTSKPSKITSAFQDIQVNEQRPTSVVSVAQHSATCSSNRGATSSIITVILPKLTTTRMIQMLMVQNAIFTPVSKLKEILQSELDRVTLLHTCYQTIDVGISSIRTPVQRDIVSDRVNRIQERMQDCPICLQSYFAQSGESEQLTAIPVYQRCCQNTICFQCLGKCIKSSSSQHLQCPLCRANIDVDISRKVMIIPFPDQDMPTWLQGMLKIYKPAPRLTQSLFQSIIQLAKSGGSRICIVANALPVHSDVSTAITTLSLLQSMYSLEAYKPIIDSAFGPDFACLLDFAVVDQIKVTKSFAESQKYIVLIKSYQVHEVDLSQVKHWIAFTQDQLEHLACLFGSRFMRQNPVTDYQIIYTDISYEQARCFEIQRE